MPEDRDDPRFVEAQSCPYCFKTDEEQRAAAIEARQAAIRRVTSPLPGSQPYDNVRPLKVSAKFDGLTLLDYLHRILGHVPHEHWQTLFEQGRMLNADHQPVGPDQVVHAGERYLHLEPATSEPEVNADIRLLYEDEAIIVLHKPAPLPMHPSGRFNRHTLQYVLGEVYRPQKPRPAHRLDANTTGLAVFARTKHFAGLLQPQFARGEVQKVYLARVIGHPPNDQFTCEAPITAAPGEFGSRDIDEESGLPARTNFRVIERFPDGTTLLEVITVTGRTNQIRVHLWQLGWPICGDQIYRCDQQLGDTQTHSVDSPPLCLLAQRITFTHPLTMQRMTFEAERPSWVIGSFVVAASNP